VAAGLEGVGEDFAGRPWRLPRRLTLGSSCSAPGRHVRGWRGRAAARTPQGSSCAASAAAAAAGVLGACGPAMAVTTTGMAEGPGGGASARISMKKAQLRSAPREKTLEKLEEYSACKAEKSCECSGWKNPSPSPIPPESRFGAHYCQTESCGSCSHALTAHVSWRMHQRKK
jgi:hypothetical protein